MDLKDLYYNKLGVAPAKEPAIRTGSNVAAVAGLLSLITVLFPELLTDREITIILVISAFVLPIVTALFTRGKVWSPASVKEVIEEATKEAADVFDELPKKENI